MQINSLVKIFTNLLPSKLVCCVSSASIILTRREASARAFVALGHIFVNTFIYYVVTSLILKENKKEKMFMYLYFC